MQAKKQQYYTARAQIAKALSHPSRLLILHALGEREMRVCELTELVGAEQPTVSKHLALLKNAGLVENHREGPMIYYRVRPACLQGFFDWLEAVAAESNRAQGKLTSGGG